MYRKKLLAAALLLAMLFGLTLPGCGLETSGEELTPTGKVCLLVANQGGDEVDLGVNDVLAPGSCQACSFNYVDVDGNTSTKATATSNCEKPVSNAGTCNQATGDFTVPQQGCTVVASVIEGQLDPNNSSSNGCVSTACGANVVKARGIALVWVQEDVQSVIVEYMTVQAAVISAHCAIYVAENPPTAQQLADTLKITDGWFTPNVSYEADQYTFSEPTNMCGDQSLVIQVDFRNVSQ